MNDNRPVNLDLRTIRLPITSYSSILHRISGVVIFLLLPVLLCMLEGSLASAESFAKLQGDMSGFFPKLVIWGVLSALLYHLVAGVRHIVMDLGWGESLEGGQLGAKITLGLSAALILIAAGWVISW